MTYESELHSLIETTVDKIKAAQEALGRVLAAVKLEDRKRLQTAAWVLKRLIDAETGMEDAMHGLVNEPGKDPG